MLQQHIYEDIGCMVLNLQAFSVSCVKRSANSVNTLISEVC